MTKKSNNEKKHDLFREICQQINVEEINESWFASGSTVTAPAFKAVLLKIAEDTGVPPKFLKPYEQTTWRLIHKSQEAMLHALLVINNPKLIYRLESFLFLFINAWELLLKAKIISDNKDVDSIFYEASKSIPLDKALDKLFTTDNDVIKLNVNLIEELRNDATHFIIPIVPNSALLLFQAGIFNYNKLLQEWFKRSLDSKIDGGMMFLISSFSPTSTSIKNALLTKKITPEVATFLKKWESKVKGTIDTLEDDKSLNSFAIPISLNMSIVKNPKKADLIGTFDNPLNENVLFALKNQRPIDTHPFTANEIAKLVMENKPDIKIKRIWELFKQLNIKNNSDLCYYNFPSLLAEKRYKQNGKIPSGTKIIYNQNALKLLLDSV